MAVFVNDTFTDTNGTNLYSHTGEAGASWSEGGWFSSPSVFVINTNRVYCSNLGTAKASGVPATAEYTVQASIAVVTSATSSAGIVARGATGVATYYRVTVRASDGLISFSRVDSGATTALGTITLGALTGTVVLAMACLDATKKVYVNGAEVLSTSDNTITAAGSAGIYAGGVTTTATTGAHFDSFTATDYTASVGRTFWSFSQVVE